MRRQIPAQSTGSLIGSAFMKQAALVTTGLGIPLAVAEYPGAPMVDSDEEIRAKVANHISHWNAGEGGASAP